VSETDTLHYFTESCTRRRGVPQDLVNISFMPSSPIMPS